MNARAWELVAVPLRALRRAGLVWGISLGALIGLTVAFYPAFQDSPGLSDAIDAMPPSLVEALGLGDFGTPAGFLRGNLYAVIVPLLLAVAGVLLMNGQTASDEDSGRMEPYLAQPVSRQSVFLGRVGGVLGWLLAISVIMLVVQLAANAAFGLDIGIDRIVAVIVLCLLLAVFHAGLAALVAGWTGRPGLVMGVGVAVAVAGYVVMALFPLADALADWRHASPWDWALGGDPLTNTTEVWRYAVLVVPAAVFIALGAWLFGDRDVTAA